MFALFKSLMQGVVEQVGHKNFPDELRTVDGALNAKIAGVLSFSELTQIIREGLCEIADQIDANQLCMPGEIELVRRYVEELSLIHILVPARRSTTIWLRTATESNRKKI